MMRRVDSAAMRCVCAKQPRRKSQRAAPVMTMASAAMWVSASRGTTVAGVRAVATVMSAPSALSSEMMRADSADTRLSDDSNVPSISLT